MSYPLPVLLSPAEVWDHVDPLAPGLAADPQRHALDQLPYVRLMGLGFERLCYELLLAEGENPRFFGQSGQADLGVDIICESSGRLACYQCKNLSTKPEWSQVRDAIAKFEADWLNRADLPCPTELVSCIKFP